MMMLMFGIQIVLLIVVVLIYKDQANFYEATIERSLQIGKILENRMKHLVRYVDKREKQRMYRELFAFKQKALDGYFGEDEKEEWKTRPFAKETEFEEKWNKEEWAPYSSKLYEEED